MENNKTSSAPLDKSVFVNNTSNKTSIGFGEIKPITHKFLLPHDSIKLGTNIHVEMKPTNGRLNSKIRLRTRKYAVPVRAIWHGYDTWITQNTDTLKGNRNLSMHKVIDNFPKTNSTTPYFDFHTLTTMLLHCWGYQNPENLALPTPLVGSTVGPTDLTLGISPSTYMLYRPVVQQISGSTATYADARKVNVTYQRWAYKNYNDRSLLGDKVHGNGVLSGVNMYEYSLSELMPWMTLDDGTTITSSNSPKLRCMVFTDPDTLALANACIGGGIKYMQTLQSSMIPTSGLVTAVVVSHCYDQSSDKLYWFVDYVIDNKGFLYDDWSSSVIEVSEKSMMYNGFVARVPWRFSSQFCSAYGDGITKMSDYFSEFTNLTTGSAAVYDACVSHVCYISNVSCQTSTNSLPVLTFATNGMSLAGLNPIEGFSAQFGLPILISAMFGRTLGKGSLLESLHMPYFQYGNLRQLNFLQCTALTSGGRDLNRIDPDICKYYDFNNTYVWCPLCPRWGGLKDFSLETFSALPLYAYQHIVTHNYRLPKDVFNDVGLADVDSAYYMTMLVPTYYGNLQTGNIFRGSCDNRGQFSSNGVRISAISTATMLRNFTSNDVNTWNQTLLIFFMQAPLIDSDAYTNMWRTQDRNITANTGIGSYVSTALDAKSRYLADKMSHFWLHGGIWQDVSTMLQDHFKVRNKHINNDCAFEYLGGSNSDVALETIKATDKDHLGEMSSQVVSDIYTNTTEYFADDFEILLELANLSVEKENFNTFDFTWLNLSYHTAQTFREQFFPEFQATGDEPNYSQRSGQNIWATNNILGYTQKNNYLKNESNRIGGDYQDINRNQLICLDNEKDVHPLELTYDYFLASPERYNSVFVNYLGSAFTLDCRTKFVRQSIMTSNNNVGL